MSSGQRRLFSVIVAALLGVLAFLNASTVTALVALPSAANVDVGARPTGPAFTPRPRDLRADAILAHNPFDSSVKSAPPADDEGPAAVAPTCAGIRPLVIVRADKPDQSVAAFDVDGKRILRRRAGEIRPGARVAFIDTERVWVENDGHLCEAPLFAPREVATREPHPMTDPRATPNDGSVESFVRGKIVKRGPGEYEIDRGAMNKMVEALGDLRKPRVAPVRDGDRVVGMRLVGIPKGSIPESLGLANGDVIRTINGQDPSNAEQMLQLWVGIRGGADRFSLEIERAGRPMTMSYAVR